MTRKIETSGTATILLLMFYCIAATAILAIQQASLAAPAVEVLLVGAGLLMLLWEVLARGARVPRAALSKLGWWALVALALAIALFRWPVLSRAPIDAVVLLAFCGPLHWTAARMKLSPDYFEMRWYERLSGHVLRQPTWIRTVTVGLLLAGLVLTGTTAFFWLVLQLGALSLIFPESEIAMAES